MTLILLEQPKQDLSNLLSDNRRLELWRDVASASYLAELIVIDNARATTAVKELEASTSSVEEGFRQRRRSYARAAFNTTRCFIGSGA
ncbi:MAG TPA: hypothetical protein VJ023_19810 [Pyrinomonadaceae bacterium]|nr:hypothetical protein [Pyrinomonadaceae bacterium]